MNTQNPKSYIWDFFIVTFDQSWNDLHIIYYEKPTVYFSVF